MVRIQKELTELIKIRDAIFPIAEEFMALMERFFEANRSKNEEQKKGAFYYFSKKAYKTLNAIVFLLEKNQVNDAYVLLRSLFEVQVTYRYISFDIPNRLDKFLNFGWIDAKRRIDSGVLKLDKNQIKEVDKKYQ
jgi:hypothetical protein